jgi:CheY-like chemotaxis protein
MANEMKSLNRVNILMAGDDEDDRMLRNEALDALRFVKSDVELRRIPVVILSTSRFEADVVDTYDVDVNSFICKPVDFSEWGAISRDIKN